MNRVHLHNEEWAKILAFLQTCPHVYIGQEMQCRRFVDGVLWMMRSGAQWRLLPTSFGKWNSVYKRFARWCEQGIWAKMLAYVANEPDLQDLIRDSTIVRAHPCAVGTPTARGGQANQALGRSRGGHTARITSRLQRAGN